ncbi:MAG: hypothetical protein K2Y27_02685 [Xanthobacteraceae bacterium]|nr:hypothetical protein [Xanthobacteraceae bacterium]
MTFDMDRSDAAAGRKTLLITASPKALNPASGRRAVLGRHALKKPGDCNQARRRSCGAAEAKSQSTCTRSEGDVPLMHSPTAERAWRRGALE